MLADADPETVFEWFLNGQKVIPNENVYVNQHEDSSMLNVRSMNLEMAGEYSPTEMSLVTPRKLEQQVVR